MQSQGSDLTQLVYSLIFFFFFPVSLLICRSHCALWSLSCWQPSQTRAVHRIMFCARLYTHTSLWRMSLLEKFLHIHLAAYYHSYADNFVICSPPRVDCESDAVALLSTEIGHKMSWFKFCSKARLVVTVLGNSLYPQKCFVAVKYVPNPVKVFLEGLTVTKKHSTLVKNPQLNGKRIGSQIKKKV